MGFTKDIVEFAMSTSGDEVPVQAHGDDLVAHGLVRRNHCGKRPASKSNCVVPCKTGTRCCRIQHVGEFRKFPARATALVNGVTSHALDYDDAHFAYVGHPSAVIVSASLALAKKHDCKGSDFLDAALIGAESACYIGAWLGRKHYQAGFHQAATAGCFGQLWRVLVYLNLIWSRRAMLWVLLQQEQLA